jgi:hypothetical protein
VEDKEGSEVILIVKSSLYHSFLLHKAAQKQRYLKKPPMFRGNKLPEHVTWSPDSLETK